MQRLPNSELDVITFASEMRMPTFFPQVGPEQVHGIEINEYAHERATATGWIGYIQWLRDGTVFSGVCEQGIGHLRFTTYPYPALRELSRFPVARR